MRRTTKVIRYSESFKQQILNDLEQGELSIAEVRRMYSIGGADTIHQRARKYCSLGVLPKIIRVEKPNEKNQLKALKEENRRLKAALADAVLDEKIAESTLEVICEQRGWDIEQIKKKAGMLLRQRQSKNDKA